MRQAAFVGGAYYYRKGASGEFKPATATQTELFDEYIVYKAAYGSEELENGNREKDVYALCKENIATLRNLAKVMKDSVAKFGEAKVFDASVAMTFSNEDGVFATATEFDAGGDRRVDVKEFASADFDFEKLPFNMAFVRDDMTDEITGLKVSVRVPNTKTSASTIYNIGTLIKDGDQFYYSFTAVFSVAK